jgi:hypothetical protein
MPRPCGTCGVVQYARFYLEALGTGWKPVPPKKRCLALVFTLKHRSFTLHGSRINLRCEQAAADGILAYMHAGWIKGVEIAIDS